MKWIENFNLKESVCIPNKKYDIFIVKNKNIKKYIAIDSAKVIKKGTFEQKFSDHEYHTEVPISKDIWIRTCNFEVDKRGGLRLVLLKESISLNCIINNKIEYELLERNCEEFLPILATTCKEKDLNFVTQVEGEIIKNICDEFITILDSTHRDNFLKIEGISYNFIDLNVSTSYHFSMEWHNIFNNEYLKNKYKYVICDGIVQKVKFSHFEAGCFASDKIKELIKEGNYKNIVEYNFHDEESIYDIDFIYEIVQE